MRASQHITQNDFHIARSGACKAVLQWRARPGVCSKALFLLLAVFMVCAFAQAVQLNSLLAEAASVRESINGLHTEQELLSAGYSLYFASLKAGG